MNTMMTPNDFFFIIALDFDDSQTAVEFVKKVPEFRFFKVGMELFYSEGPSILDRIRAAGEDIKIFLDLKINDIPKTIEKTVRRLSAYKPDYLTVFTNASGIKAAVDGSSGSGMRILNVTVLTSDTTTLDQVRERAMLSRDHGAHGIICSGQETASIRSMVRDPGFIIVNPGIRLHDSQDDQKRTVTPIEALKAGATNVVVGRPITLSSNPRQTAREYLDSIRVP